MRIIALMNQKGGVGKTTTTVNLGAALGEAGKRVCLIDLDPQAHLTINYGVEPNTELTSLYHVLLEDRSLLEAMRKVNDRIALVPSSIDLAGAEIELVSVLGRERILKERLEVVKEEFDFVLLDCPPSLGLLTINALAVADEVIIPMQPHFLALQGVGKLLETVALMSRRMNPKLKVSGIVLTMFDSQTKLSNEVVNDLNGFIESAKGKNLPWADARIFDSKIRRNIKLAESPSFGKTIIDYEPNSNGAQDYRALALEILSMSKPVPPPVVASPVAQAAPRSAPAASPATVKPVANAAPATKPLRKPPAAKTPVPGSKAVSVTVNPELEPARLAAAKVPVPPTPAPAPAAAPAGDGKSNKDDAEVAA